MNKNIILKRILLKMSKDKTETKISHLLTAAYTTGKTDFSLFPVKSQSRTRFQFGFQKNRNTKEAEYKLENTKNEQDS